MSLKIDFWPLYLVGKFKKVSKQGLTCILAAKYFNVKNSWVLGLFLVCALFNCFALEHDSDLSVFK